MRLPFSSLAPSSLHLHIPTKDLYQAGRDPYNKSNGFRLPDNKGCPFQMEDVTLRIVKQ